VHEVSLPADLVGRLHSWLASPTTAGIFLDFDGTLAPIVAVPDEARPLPGVASTLGRLAVRYRRVAVISGRPLAFLAEHLGEGSGAVEFVGLYGLERQVGSEGPVVVDAEARPWQAAVDAVAAAAQAAAPPGLRVERKGLAVTLHFRQAPDLAGWTASFAAEQAGASGLIAHPGKQSWELRPPGPTDKGTVVAELASGLQAVCFAGDDIGDLPAFAALTRFRAAGVDTLSVAVGSAETPAEVLAAGDVVVAGPAGVLDLLEALADLPG
jgi:trehalose 6-phosphate phosphatase